MLCLADQPDESSINASPSVDTMTVATCAVIHDENIDFGLVHSCNPPAQELCLPSQRIDPSMLAHLTDAEKQQLLAVLDKYADVFRDDPWLYPGVKHRIPLTDNFKARRLKEYKIPGKK